MKSIVLVTMVLGILTGCTSIQLIGSDAGMCAAINGIEKTSKGFVAPNISTLATNPYSYSDFIAENFKEKRDKDESRDSVRLALSLINNGTVGESFQLNSIRTVSGESFDKPISWAHEYQGVDDFSEDAWPELENARNQLQQFRKAMNSNKDGSPSIKLNARSLKLFSKIQDTFSNRGFDILALEQVGKLYRRNNQFYSLSAAEKTANRFDIEKIMEEAEFNESNFLATYLRAYFRGGKFIQVGVDTQALASKLSSKVTDSLPVGTLKPDQLSKVNAAIEAQLKVVCNQKYSTSCLLSQSLGENAFIARHGGSTQYAGIDISLGSEGKLAAKFSYPKTLEVAPQVARVIVEALFDAGHPRVPSVAGSTACVKGLYENGNDVNKHQCLSQDSHPNLKKKIAYIDEHSARSEALSIAISSQLIRGLSIVSLDNEAVANTLATLAGVIARKTVEKRVWNKYQNINCSVNMPIVSVMPKR